jgi:hypothetical protein
LQTSYDLEQGSFFPLLSKVTARHIVRFKTQCEKLKILMADDVNQTAPIIRTKGGTPQYFDSRRPIPKDHWDLAGILFQAIAHLPPRHRAVFEAYMFEGRGLDEMALDPRFFDATRKTRGTRTSLDRVSREAIGRVLRDAVELVRTELMKNPTLVTHYRGVIHPECPPARSIQGAVKEDQSLLHELHLLHHAVVGTAN